MRISKVERKMARTRITVGTGIRHLAYWKNI
jgi:hypothetical protein